jgi:hypothetical protein
MILKPLCGAGLEPPAPPSFFAPPRSNFAPRTPVPLLPPQPTMHFMHAPVGEYAKKSHGTRSLK